MSIVKLQSISTISRTSNPDFYVGAVVDSESGYLFPKLITNNEQLDTYFDEFPYKNMYRKLIENNIPVCLLPTITRESDYNRCSLRLSNGTVTVSHPKIGKEYRYVSLSNLFHYVFSKSEIKNSLKYTISHGLKFYPKIVVESNGEEIKTRKVYNDDSITLYFSERVSGSIWIESIPQIESDPDFIKIDRFGKLGSSVTPKYELEVPNKVIPEIVVTIDEGPNKGEMVETYIKVEEVSGVNKVTVTPKVPLFDVRYRIDIRIIPSGLLISRDALTETNIYHNSNRFPLFKFDRNGEESWGKVEYRTTNYTVITVSDPDGMLIRYNIINANKDFNFNLLNTHQMMFNLLLDFTDVSYENLVKRGSLTDPSNFLIIDTANEQCLVASGEWHGVTSNYYSTNAVYYFEDGSGSTDSEKKENTLTKFKNWFNNRYSNSCTNLEDQMSDFIKKFLVKKGLPYIDQFGKQPFINDWKDLFIDEAYKWDFWIERNEVVVDYLRKILEKYDEDVLVSETDLLSEVGNLKLSNDKLLIEYVNPVQNLNHFRFDGVNVTDSYNLTQDKLCSFTERDKVVDIFSKIKGKVGKRTYVEIKKVKNYEGVYDILISNDVITENYIVRLYDVGNIPIDTIYITDINKHSELVSIYLYDYWIQNKLIDSIYFDESEYGEPFNPNNIRKKSDLKLPEGKFYLERNLSETITIESRRNSLDIFKKSDWFPDLFLVDSLPDSLRYSKYVLDSVRWKENVEDSMFTQALIKLNPHQLSREWFRQDGYLTSEENRVIYFYDDMEIDGVMYPSYYPYILNIIRQKYLNLPKDKVLYEPFRDEVGNNLLLSKYGEIAVGNRIEKKVGNYRKLSCRSVDLKNNSRSYIIHGEIDGDKFNVLENSESNTVIETLNIERNLKGFLEDKHINYLDLDNLKYFYNTILETPGQRSIFIIQFILSKYTREIFSVRGEMIGLEVDRIRRKLEDINSRCLRVLPLVLSSKVKLSRTDINKVEVTYSIILNAITNKEYKLNYILNI